MGRRNGHAYPTAYSRPIDSRTPINQGLKRFKNEKQVQNPTPVFAMHMKTLSHKVERWDTLNYLCALCTVAGVIILKANNVIFS